MTVNVGHLLGDAARRYPDRVAVSFLEEQVTYGELLDRVGRFAAVLHDRGLKPGDRLLVALPNIAEFYVCAFGAFQSGVVVVPINPLMAVADVEHYVRDAEPEMAVCADGFVDRLRAGASAAGRPALDIVSLAGSGAVHGLRVLLDDSSPREPARTAPDDLAVLIYTSGTTGQPKGAGLSHASLVMMAQQLITHLGWSSSATGVPDKSQESVLGVPPLFHGIGLAVITNCVFMSAGRIHLVDRFDVESAVDDLERHAITTIIGVPSMFAALAREQQRKPRDLEALSLGVCGGSPLPPEIRTSIGQHLELELLQAYGLSEVTALATIWTRGQTLPIDSIGRAVWGVEVMIRDRAGREVAPGVVGEICLRGHTVMLGYWRRPKETEEAIDADGWFRSGDLGRIDAEGNVFIVDRIKNMIIRNGFNVYPRELEDRVLQYPGVLQAAVVGVEDLAVGEEVALFVVPEANHRLDVEALNLWLGENFAPQKRPRIVRVLDEMPMTPTGKIRKTALRLDVASA